MVGKIASFFFLVVVVNSKKTANTEWEEKFNPNINSLPLKSLDSHHSPPKLRSPINELTKVENCGIAPLAPSADSRITAGVEATPHEFPWEAALYLDDMKFCGGSIISDEWILTAAHCLYNTSYVYYVLGAHNVTAPEETQLSFYSFDFIIHENFDNTSKAFDIGMIHLLEKIVFNDYIQPICLPTLPDLGSDVPVTVAGWGTDELGDPFSDILIKVDSTTLTNDVCAPYYFPGEVTEDMLCVNREKVQGICNGDSGGPLNYKVDGVTEVRGIASWGFEYGCNSANPDVYTRVTHYLDWIQENTNVTRA